MKSIEVKVEQRHILSGRRSSRFYCPIALRLKEMFPDSKVVVQLDVINIDGIDYATPEKAAQFMGTYDWTRWKKDVPPIEFNLPKACPVCKHEAHNATLCSAIIDKDKETERPCPCGGN